MFPADTLTDAGELIKCTQVVLCTGTFLSGEIHIGALAYRLHSTTVLNIYVYIFQA
jgi:tRNA U34 5-carboxymethylaminomethyl modifying enzyme MnmG/GidA